jgi:hypothetical protein
VYRDIDYSNQLLGVEVRKNKEIKLKVKLKDLALASETGALQQIYNQSIPVATAYKLSKFIKTIAVELEHYHAERIKLCEAHGIKDAETQTYKIRPEERADFDRQIAELQSIEVDLPGEKISIDAFGKAEMPAAIIDLLNWMFE